jgi:hypothetical protein
VGENSAFGDGEAEAGAFGAVFDATERDEDGAQHVLRDAGTVVADADYSIVGIAEERDLDLGALGGVADGVAEDVFERTAEGLFVGGDDAIGVGGDGDAAIVGTGFEIGVGGNVMD